ncbi:MAG: hypothetical protein D6712_20910 [Chloroflexi bacterium]|nr:MAG: hypothetical protein D6712_20910 [Chloroflexota bacterium]
MISIIRFFKQLWRWLLDDISVHDVENKVDVENTLPLVSSALDAEILTTLNVRQLPSIYSTIKDKLTSGKRVKLVNANPYVNDGYVWYQLQDTKYWIAYYSLDNPNEFYFKILAAPSDSPVPSYDIPTPPVTKKKLSINVDGRTVIIYDEDDVLYPARSIGTNSRRLAYWGTGVLPYVNAAIREQYINFLRQKNVRIVRFYAPDKNFTIEECIKHVRYTLDALNVHGAKAVLVLTDALGKSGAIVKGTEHFYDYGKYDYITVDKLNEFSTVYLDYASKMLEAIGQHPALLYVEPFNEFAVYPEFTMRNIDGVFDFFRDVLATLKNKTDAFWSTGLVNAVHLGGHAMKAPIIIERLRALGFDLMSLHVYKSYDTASSNIVEFARAMQELTFYHQENVPYFIGEFGVDRRFPDRVELLRHFHAETARYHNGLCYWTLEPPRAIVHDSGDGDNFYGINQRIADDYELLIDYISRTNVR